MTEQDGLISAYRLDGAGGGEKFGSWDAVPTEKSADLLWVHINRNAAQAQTWIQEKSGLRPLIQEALLAEEPRPRCVAIDEGILLNLRGVNLNPGSDPEDMVSIRLWIEKDRIVSSRQRHLMAIEDMRNALDAGKGPENAESIVVMIAERLTARMDPTLDALQDQLDELEDSMIRMASRELRSQLTELRRETIMLRRYISPQREALRQLATLEIPWISRRRRERLMEVADRVTRYMEDLDVIRDRATVINDELANRISERMDRTMYILSLVTLIFLPLTVISGMLGMNVGGVPGEKAEWAFYLTCAIFLAIAAFEVWLIRRLRWWV